MPDYLEIVQEPVDLQTIARSVLQVLYSGRHSLAQTFETAQRTLAFTSLPWPATMVDAGMIRGDTLELELVTFTVILKEAFCRLVSRVIRSVRTAGGVTLVKPLLITNSASFILILHMFLLMGGVPNQGHAHIL